MTGFVVPRCECGHPPADHLPGGSSLYAKTKGGKCMAPDCDCQKFVEAEARDADWLQQAAKRLDEHEAEAWRRMR